MKVQPKSSFVSLFLFSLLARHAFALTFRVITHDVNAGMKDPANKPQLDVYKANSEDADALILLVQDGAFTEEDLPSVQEGLGFEDETYEVLHFKKEEHKRLHTFVIFKKATKDKLESIDIKEDKAVQWDAEEGNATGYFAVKMTIDGHLYLIANVNLENEEDKKEEANKQLAEIYEYITLEKNQHLYGTQDPKEINAKNGEADDGKEITVIMGGSFVKTGKKTLEKLGAENDQDAILAAFKDNVGEGPLIDWMARDKAQYDSFVAEEGDHKRYAKTVFEEVGITFNPSEVYEVHGGDKPEDEAVYGKIGEKAEMSYTNRILYHVGADKEVSASGYELVLETAISNSKPVKVTIEDKNVYKQKAAEPKGSDEE